MSALQTAQAEVLDLSENVLQKTICSVDLGAHAEFGTLKSWVSGTFGL